jgi:hypothetical protein
LFHTHAREQLEREWVVLEPVEQSTVERESLVVLRS